VMAKGFETHTPLGPWIVTAEEIGNPHDLALKTWINGELRQDSRTSEMISNCYELVAELSGYFPLNPGDIILTGTPAGSGIFQNPPQTLRVGDVVKCEIEGIGAIENRIVDEPVNSELQARRCIPN
jgi:2-keto-4-pentenoate hydratase/2-oxohepta-3-ene-1,7-dioic acid hydratase in catechol pathway